MSFKTISTLVFACAFALAGGVTPGCTCANSGVHYGDGGVILIGTLSISPPDVTLNLVLGTPPPSQAYTVTWHSPNGDKDVTTKAKYILSDPTAGSMSGPVFTSGNAHGGTTEVIATYTPPGSGQLEAIALVHVKVKGTFVGPDCAGGTCPPFPPDTAPACTAANVKPTVVYPPDGVLLPPNMSVIAVQWTPFPGGPPAVPITAFEVDFSNAITDARIITKCTNQLIDTNGGATGGCQLTLDPAMWDFVAKSNRGGDAVKVTVRATTDGVCATPSTDHVMVSFASDDLNGGLFYWKSTTTIGVGVGGQIWAKSFGNALPEEQITGVAGTNLTAGCHGCHSLSRDGARMVVNFDDDDSDDEYSDTKSADVDVKMKNAFQVPNTGVKQGQPPGFQTFNPDHSLYLGTDGDNTSGGNVLFAYNGADGTPAATPLYMNIGPANSRATMIDWSPDAKSVLFVLPMADGSAGGGPALGPWRADDDHVFGGSIYSIAWDSMAKTFGAFKPIVMSAGENNFYPSYSPDGQFIVFNRVPLTGTVATIDQCNPATMGARQSCPNDSFANPATRVWILSTKANSVPVDAEKANGSPASAPQQYSNSWPRWSPFIQNYRGSRLLWVTFSSTRDYGLRVRNHQPGMFPCYPSDSLQDPGGPHSQPFPTGCQQPQIFMAAINLSTAEVSAQGDPSFPAFWLPFQAEVDSANRPTHNHTAQWTQTVVTQQPDGGACIGDGQNCTANPTNCCAPDTCSSAGICSAIIQ